MTSLGIALLRYDDYFGSVIERPDTEECLRRDSAELQQGFVLPAERGSGVGAMLTAEFHAELAKAGVAVTLLHYSQVNPLSAPFWSQQGYRPLWATWDPSFIRLVRTPGGCC